MKVHRGDVVLVDYQFSDRTGSKVRPCLVVQNDVFNRRLNDTILKAISSNISRAANMPTQQIIDLATSAGQQSGLLFDSAVQCENLVTVDMQFIIRRIGALPAATMISIDERLKLALGMS